MQLHALQPWFNQNKQGGAKPPGKEKGDQLSYPCNLVAPPRLPAGLLLAPARNKQGVSQPKNLTPNLTWETSTVLTNLSLFNRVAKLSLSSWFFPGKRMKSWVGGGKNQKPPPPTGGFNTTWGDPRPWAQIGTAKGGFNKTTQTTYPPNRFTRTNEIVITCKDADHNNFRICRVHLTPHPTTQSEVLVKNAFPFFSVALRVWQPCATNRPGYSLPAWRAASCSSALV